jgi:cytochrome c-type biogenesis protein CcmE
MNRWPYILGALIILGFGYMGVTEMMASRMPYMTKAAEVRATNGRAVQVIGTILHKDAHYDDAKGTLVFFLADDRGDALKVSYKGIKPANFDTSPKAVARGKYIDGVLVADQLLLKCPSRYRGGQR